MTIEAAGTTARRPLCVLWALPSWVLRARFLLGARLLLRLLPLRRLLERHGWIGLPERKGVAFDILAAGEPALAGDRSLLGGGAAELADLAHRGVDVLDAEVHDRVAGLAVLHLHDGSRRLGPLREPVVDAWHPRV